MSDIEKILAAVRDHAKAEFARFGLARGGTGHIIYERNGYDVIVLVGRKRRALVEALQEAAEEATMSGGDSW